LSGFHRGETGCNQILARFLFVKSPTKGLNVPKIPFREVTLSCRLVNAAGIIISTRSNSSEMLLLDRNLDP
jgi:hypothetical protein